MEDNSLKAKTAKGLFWSGLSNGITQVFSVIFGVILLNYLTPSDYGKIAIILVFSNIAGCFQESGFNAALINKKDIKQEDYNSVFWFNIIMSGLMYTILFFCAPLIADFYHEPILCPLSRYVLLGFFISSFGLVQTAFLIKNLMIKHNSLIGLLALVISNTVGIILAMNGFAYWGLATQTLLYVSIIVIVKWYISPWRPNLKIDFRPALSMFGFSSKLLVTYLFNQLNSNVFSILLGKFYSSHTVGYYSNAKKWNDMATGTINGMVNGVVQPVMVQAGENKRLCRIFSKMIRFICFVSFPCMFGLAIVSKELIQITVGNTWIQSAEYLSILCVCGAFAPISNLYSNLVISKGRSDINMVNTIVLCVLIWMILFLLKGLGVKYMVVSFVILNIVWLFVWQYFAKRIVGIKYTRVIKDILPFLLIALSSMAFSYWLTSFIDNIYVRLVTKILLAAAVYMGLMYVTGAKVMRESLNYLRGKR